MYLIHFFNAQGKYQVPVYQEDVHAMVEVVFTYKDLVPGIRVTQVDEVVFETVQGSVVWPKIAADALAAMAEAFPPALRASALDVLSGYRQSVARAEAAGAGEQELAFAQLRAAEIPLLAYAASEGLNLNGYGYRPAEVIITEIEEADLTGD